MMPQSIPFDAAKWIYKHHCYPEFHVPKDVLYECCRLLCVPPYYRGLLPRSSLSIQELIKTTSLPSFNLSLQLDPGTFFSLMQPDLDLPFNLASHTIPCIEVTSMLLDSFSQQWFDGVMSFQDPRQPSHYLPFWVLVWWNKLGLVVEARQAWSTAWSWISGCANEVHPSFHII
jgi:hypothetical protein